jgi:hypothetical protein
MAGVDLVISALFETSGFRSAGDCAKALPKNMMSIRSEMEKNLVAFNVAILLRLAEGESVKRADFNPCLPNRPAVAVANAGALIS